MIERYYKYTRMYHLKVSICRYMMKIPVENLMIWGALVKLEC